MSILLKNIIRFILFILVQVLILREVPPLHHMVVPYVYFLFLLWLPFNISRLLLLFLAFVFGFALDCFYGVYGLHTAPCLLIAYIRPFLLSLLIPQETTEQSYVEPSIKSMGFAPYALYVTLLTFLHHTYLVLIEWLQFGHILYFLGKVAAGTAVSLILIAIAEMLFFRKEKYRTNAA